MPPAIRKPNIEATAVPATSAITARIKQ